MARSTEPELVQNATFLEWRTHFERRLKAVYPEYPFNPSLNLGELLARQIILWCEEHEVPEDERWPKLNEIDGLVTGLYDALLPGDAPRDKPRSYFWRHLDIDRLFRTTSKSYRDEIVNRYDLKQLASQYLDRPWMHVDFVDWIFADSLVAAELIATYEWVRERRGGLVYFLFEGKRFKTVLFKVVQIPTIFFLNWVLPGLVCWWAYQYYPMVAVIAALLYYGINIVWLIVQIGRRIAWRLGGGKSFRRLTSDRLSAMLNAYVQMREETIHVPSLARAIDDAASSGVVWDPQLLCIVDLVKTKHPISWTRCLPQANY